MLSSSFLVALAAVFSSAFALKLQNENNFAYVITWMNKDYIPVATKLAEVMTEEEESDYMNSHEDYKNRHGFMNKGTQEQLATEAADSEETPKGGYKISHIFTLDDQLRSAGSKYPLVVMTNDPALINSPELENHPNMIILKVSSMEGAETRNEHDVSFVHTNARIPGRNKMHVQKLAVFNMTQYEKVLSLDMDIQINKNLDHIFTDYNTDNGSQVWGIMNDFDCSSKDSRGHRAKWRLGVDDYFNSAVMLLQPKQEIFDGILNFTSSGERFWGDQFIVQRYFQTKQHRMPRLFPVQLADYGWCYGEEGMKKLEVAHRR